MRFCSALRSNRSFGRRDPHTNRDNFTWIWTWTSTFVSSGHATRIGGLIIVLGSPLPVWGLAILVPWGLGVCVSRVALQLHYTSDIAASLFLGLAVGMLLQLI